MAEAKVLLSLCIKYSLHIQRNMPPGSRPLASACTHGTCCGRGRGYSFDRLQAREEEAPPYLMNKKINIQVITALE